MFETFFLNTQYYFQTLVVVAFLALGVNEIFSSPLPEAQVLVPGPVGPEPVLLIDDVRKFLGCFGATFHESLATFHEPSTIKNGHFVSDLNI